MAYTKIIAVRTRLDHVVAYAVNADKTGLETAIEYTLNADKTETRLFASTLNCEGIDTAYREMTETKRRWNKTDKVLAYHFIQSFAPNEVTSEQAHAIGMEFANQLFGERFEVVIATHLDKNHLHNHIVLNSVSFVDGKKYHSSPESYYNQIRGTSDELCRQNDLSVIAPKGRGRHYAEWEADNKGKVTIRSFIRQDIDEAISGAYTYNSFLNLLEKKGYAIKCGSNIKHTAIRPKGSTKYFRLSSLGEGYSEENIKERLTMQRNGISTLPLRVKPEYRPPRYLPCRKRIQRVRPHRKLHGFPALYFKYLYLLNKVKKRKLPNRTAFLLRDDLRKFDRYQVQFRLLYEAKIETLEDFNIFAGKLQAEMDNLSLKRHPLYAERRNSENDVDKDMISAQIAEITSEMRKIRKTIAICKRIQEDAPTVSKKVKEVRERSVYEQNKLRKEERRHEHR